MKGQIKKDYAVKGERFGCHSSSVPRLIESCCRAFDSTRLPRLTLCPLHAVTMRCDDRVTTMTNDDDHHNDFLLIPIFIAITSTLQLFLNTSPHGYFSHTHPRWSGTYRRSSTKGSESTRRRYCEIVSTKRFQMDHGKSEELWEIIWESSAFGCDADGALLHSVWHHFDLPDKGE